MDFPNDNQRRPTLAEMMGGGVSSSEQSYTPPKRRMTMQEMLRESAMLMAPVPLPDAVNAAQEAKARKAAAEESQGAGAAASPAAEAPAPAAVDTTRSEPPDVAAESPSIASIAAMAPDASVNPLGSSSASDQSGLATHRYNLYARIGGRWVWQTDIHASSHAHGLQQAIASLKPEHAEVPIRIEQDETAA